MRLTGGVLAFLCTRAHKEISSFAACARHTVGEKDILLLGLCCCPNADQGFEDKESLRRQAK